MRVTDRHTDRHTDRQIEIGRGRIRAVLNRPLDFGGDALTALGVCQSYHIITNVNTPFSYNL